MAPNIRVGKYILKRKIGEGAFAVVRHAIHEETRKEYAVKVFERASLPKGDFERDVRREVRIMQHLRHPNIVSIHAVLVTTTKMYLVMELVRGGELYDEIVARRRIDEDTSRKYFQQLVDAMIYCHRRGVVHRDLKPENLLLDENGNLKVTDFGMSSMKDKVDPQCKTKLLLRTQCGTPKYMAPEIIVRPNKGYDGEKLDAWECGMVLYALLAGYLPFSGEDDDSVFRSILKGVVKFPSFFSAGAKDVLQSLLQKDPEKRASLAQVRQHPWFLVNYFGDASPSPLRSKPSTDSKILSENGGVQSSFAVPSSSLEIRNADGNEKCETGHITGTSLPPISPTHLPSISADVNAAARCKQVMSLSLDLIEEDPFDTELGEVEVPATPMSTRNGNATAKWNTVGEQKSSPTHITASSSIVEQEAPVVITTPSRRTKGKDAWMGGVFGVRPSFVGTPRSCRVDGDEGSKDGLVSIRNRIIASPLGAAIRSLREGFSPNKNGKTDDVEPNLPDPASFTDESPTSVTATASASPVSVCRNKNDGSVLKDSGTPKRKFVKAFQRKTD